MKWEEPYFLTLSYIAKWYGYIKEHYFAHGSNVGTFQYVELRTRDRIAGEALKINGLK